MRLPQVCQFCGRSLADPGVPPGVDGELFSLAMTVPVDGREVLVCPFCQKVIWTG